MVDWSLVPRGILIRLSVAASIWPMAVLCIRRSLSGGRLHGLNSGLGVALPDALFGCIAAFGLTSISGVLVDHQNVIRLIGRKFLINLRLRTLRSGAADLSQGQQEGRRSYLVALGLTLTNPLTILSFAAIFVGFGFANEQRGGASAGLFTAGVFAGSMLWWIALTSMVTLLRDKLTNSRLTSVTRVSVALILIFGVIAIFSVIT